MSPVRSTLLRRAAALAILGALLALCYLALVRPFLEAHRRYDESIARLSRSLEQQRTLAQEEPRIQQVMNERKRIDVARRHYLAERNATLASAELQGLVKGAVAQGRGELISMQVVSSPKQDALRQVTLRVRMRGDMGALQRMLHTLEGGLPILVVNQLSIDAAAGGELFVSFDVSGQMRGRRE
jgi:general secretion pathway protein M